MRSRRFILSSLPLSLMLALGLLAVSGGNAGATRPVVITVALSGDQEVAPAIGDKAATPGADGYAGSGVAVLELFAGEQQICYEFDVENIQLPASGAHIHKAPAGVNGPVVVAFSPPGAGGTSAGCVAVNRLLIRDIVRHSGQYYVNVHTPEFSAGALRGQIG